MQSLPKNFSTVVFMVLLGLFIACGGFLIHQGIPFFIDDLRQRTYGDLNLRYIFEGSTELMSYYNLRFYGPFWEILSQLIVQSGLSLLPADQTRQYMVLISAAIGLIFLYKTAQLILPEKFSIIPPLVLVSIPQFFQNALINSKDIPFLSSFCASMYFLNRFFVRRKTSDLVLFCVLSALTTNIRIGGLFLTLIFAIYFVFKTVRGEFHLKNWLHTGLVVCVSFLPTLYLSYPWIWDDPLRKFISAIQFNGQFNNGGALLYLGQIYYLNEGIPRSYPWVHLGLSLPPTFLIFSLLGTVYAITKPLLRKTNFEAMESQDVDILIPNALWVLLPLLLITLKGANLYNGLRQILFILPGVSLMSGLFVLFIYNLGRRYLSRLSYLFVVAQSVFTIAIMAHLNPYFGAYFNFFAGSLDKIVHNHTVPTFQTYMKEAIDFTSNHSQEQYSVSGPFVGEYLKKYGQNLGQYISLSQRNQAKYYISYPEYDLLVPPPQGEVIKRISRNDLVIAYILLVRD